MRALSIISGATVFTYYSRNSQSCLLITIYPSGAIMFLLYACNIKIWIVLHIGHAVKSSFGAIIS